MTANNSKELPHTAPHAKLLYKSMSPCEIVDWIHAYQEPLYFGYAVEATPEIRKHRSYTTTKHLNKYVFAICKNIIVLVWFFFPEFLAALLFLTSKRKRSDLI